MKNDGDVIRGLGFVVLYAAYLEEQIDKLLLMLQSLEVLSESGQRWSTSQKIKKIKQLVTKLRFQEKDSLLNNLDKLKQLFDWRNEVIHGRIQAGFDSPDTLKSSRPNTPDRILEASELYILADNLTEARNMLCRLMIFQIPRALLEIIQ